MINFLCPIEVKSLTTQNLWLNQFFNEDVVLGEEQQYTFSKRHHNGDVAVYYGFLGELIFESLITLPVSAEHTRTGLKLKGGSMRLEFPKNHPEDIHIGFSIFKRAGKQSYFVAMAAQDTLDPENYVVHWGYGLDGELNQVFAEINDSFTEMSRFSEISEEN